MRSARSTGAHLEVTREEAAVAIEPAFRLEEGEKEQSRQPEQRDLSPIRCPRSCRRTFGQMCDHTIECAIEATGERIPAQHLHPSSVRHDVVAITRRGRQRAERLGIARHDVPAIDGERCDTRACAVGSPRRQGERRSRALDRDQEPEEMRSPGRQAWGSRGDPFAQRRTARPFQQQDSQRARSGDDARAGRVAKSQRDAGVIVDRERCARASDRACERRECSSVAAAVSRSAAVCSESTRHGRATARRDPHRPNARWLENGTPRPPIRARPGRFHSEVEAEVLPEIWTPQREKRFPCSRTSRPSRTSRQSRTRLFPRPPRRPRLPSRPRIFLVDLAPSTPRASLARSRAGNVTEE